MKKKTFTDIEKLSKYDPTIYTFLEFYKDGVLTKEETLIEMVVNLYDLKEHLTNELIDIKKQITGWTL